MNIACNDLWTRNTGVVYGPPAPFLFVCYLLYTLSDRTMHKFGVVVHVQYSTKSSTSTHDRSLKNESFVVHSDRRCSHGCTWWVLYNFRIWIVALSLKKFCFSLKASLNNATLKQIKWPQNNRRVSSLALAANMIGFYSVNRTAILKNAYNSLVKCFY